MFIQNDNTTRHSPSLSIGVFNTFKPLFPTVEFVAIATIVLYALLFFTQFFTDHHVLINALTIHSTTESANTLPLVALANHTDVVYVSYNLALFKLLAWLPPVYSLIGFTRAVIQRETSNTLLVLLLVLQPVFVLAITTTAPALVLERYGTFGWAIIATLIIQLVGWLTLLHHYLTRSTKGL